MAKAIVTPIMAETTRVYIEAGEPFGPASNWDNVMLWFDINAAVNRAEWDRHDQAMERWVTESTVGAVAGEPVPAPPAEPT
jgi:hypothetical protein